MNTIKIAKLSGKKFYDFYEIKLYRIKSGDNLVMADYSFGNPVIKIGGKK